MPEAQVETKEPEYVEPPRIQVVTPDNFDAYVEEKLGPLEPAQTPEEMEEELKAEDVEKQAPEKVEPKKGKKHELNERFSELTEARKAAEKRAEEQSARAKALQEERDKAAKEAADLKAKYEPPKAEEPEPQPSQFTDINEYAKAIKDWTAENTRREDAKKAAEQRVEAERQAVTKAWNERLAKTKTEIEDYETVINDSSVKVSNEVRDAILESDIGPQLLYHFAKNPDDADRIGQMTVGRALKELGKLEAKLSGGTAEPAPKRETSVAEISKAPAPISPLKGSSTQIQPKMDADGNFHGTYEEWKAFRRSGKIK